MTKSRDKKGEPKTPDPEIEKMAKETVRKLTEEGLKAVDQVLDPEKPKGSGSTERRKKKDGIPVVKPEYTD